jgi:hypothetical protein
MYKIAILYICTGKYDVFWKDFYESSEKYFLPKHKKTYFVFTDSETLYGESNENIVKIHQNDLGWPNNTLLRFEMFEKVLERLKEFDFIYFCNANLLFLEEVNEEFLPIEEGLLAVKHPGYFDKKPTDFPYDRNEKSLAYIPLDEGNHYFMGGLNGGNAKEYIKLIQGLNKNIHEDLHHGIVAVWHDESHINKYLLDKRVKILNSGYGYPEGWELPFKPIILIRDKSKWGGHHFLRNTKDTYTMRIKRKIKKLLKLK